MPCSRARSPTRAAARKLVFISTFEAKTFRPAARAKVIAAEPMAESAMAPTNPPCTMPAGLANRSSARIRQTVRPGTDLSTQVMPEGELAVGGHLDPLVGHGARLVPLARADTGGMVRSVPVSA